MGTYWAELDENNLVIRVLVGHDDALLAYDWLLENLGGTWLQTYDDGSTRFNYASPGFSYDDNLDAFIPPKPYYSWVLDESTCLWVAPVEYPTDGLEYTWDEATMSWVEVPGETV